MEAAATVPEEEKEYTIDSSLLDTPIGSAIQKEISTEFWGATKQHQRLNGIEVDLQPYWSYYGKECSHALHDGGRHVAARTHRDIVQIVRQLRGGLLREDIKAGLRSKLTVLHANEDELLDNSIDLAAGLLLMIDFGGFSFGFSGRTELNWREASLAEFVQDYFGDDSILAYERVKMEKNFTARNLGRIAGVEIVWTDNLVDHLRMTDDDTRVHIFHHASFLETQKKSETLFPPGLAEETIATLALLFPSTNSETKKWFVKLPASPHLDPRVIQCGRLKTDHRQIECFHYWRQRLVTLKQVFDEAQPKTLSQWWHDRRNGVQWYTFWVAVLVLVLTIVFGLIQSVEGALQVYASFKSIKDSE